MPHSTGNQKRNTSRGRTRLNFRVSLTETFLFNLQDTLRQDVHYYLDPATDTAIKCACKCRDFDMLSEVTASLSLATMLNESPLTTPSKIACLRQVGSLLDKVNIPGSEDEKARRAITSFVACDKQCSEYNTIGWKQLDGSDIVGHMREFCSKVLGPVFPDVGQLWSRARHGPGAVCQQPLSIPSVYAKYADWPYSVTASARPYAISYIQSDPLWLGALESSYRERFNIPSYKVLNWEVFWNNVLLVVPGNRITTVRKDRLKDRPIAIEPTLNMMLQLGADGYIRRRLKRKYHIDLDNQIPNQQLARAGSFDPTLFAPATIDLSSASDLISLRIAKLILPEQWYCYLCALRSPQGQLPDGTVIRYSKLSSMGNGSTFAVESLIFAAVCYAAAKLQGQDIRDLPVSVFGDDIIVPEFLVPDVLHILDRSGFSVNKAKSFTTGHVKESCGADWFRAYPVRPVYVRSIPRDLPELFHIHNSLYLWSEQHSIPLTRTMNYLVRVIRHFNGHRFSGSPTEDTTSHAFSCAETGLRIRRSAIVYKPRDFLFGKLLGLLRCRPSPFYQSIWEKTTVRTGSVFDISPPRRWRYSTYKARPNGRTFEVRDYCREYYYYLRR